MLSISHFGQWQKLLDCELIIQVNVNQFFTDVNPDSSKHVSRCQFKPFGLATLSSGQWVKKTRFINASDVISGMFYCSISDHFPCFLSIESKHISPNIDKLMVTLFGDRNISHFKELMGTYVWNCLYIPNIDWYCAFISVVKRLYLSCFLLFPVFRNRAKD